MSNNNKRPLSPHLTIYKKNQTTLLSITHRITGLALSFGSVFIVSWILFIALGEKYFNILYFFFETVTGKAILITWSFAIFFHLINGIRYLIWSTGYAMESNILYKSGYFVIFFSLLLTILVWLSVLDIL